MADEFGDRMKLYEGYETERRFMPLLPIVVRVDGRSFHNFCSGLKRPFDGRLSALMIEVTKHLVDEFNARIGYTQSDEISLVICQQDFYDHILFDGKVHKFTSIVAAQASVFFNKNLEQFIPEKADKTPVFDGRAWNVPTREEAANAILWREQDATKNSIQMAARSYFSHSQLHHKNGKEMQEMLFQKGVNWNDYPSFFKRGTFVRRKTISTRPTVEELEALPEKHNLRKNPSMLITRRVIEPVDMPKFSSVTNREAVIFDGAEPIVGV